MTQARAIRQSPGHQKVKAARVLLQFRTPAPIGPEVKMNEEKPKPKLRGNAGKGRRKGSVNKTTAMAKHAIALAGEKLGGAERLVEWVKEDPQNERVFWSQIYTKLMPYQVEGSGDDGAFVCKVIFE